MLESETAIPPPPPYPPPSRSLTQVQKSPKQNSSHVPKRSQLRTSIVKRSRVSDVFPPAFGNPIWEVPTGWDPNSFSALSAKKHQRWIDAIVRTLKKRDDGLNCQVGSKVHVAIKETGEVFKVHSEEWLTVCESLVSQHKTRILKRNFKIVIPFRVTFLNPEGSREGKGHAMTSVLAQENGKLVFWIFDGNGYIPDWHDDIIRRLKKVLKGVRVRMDASSPCVNFAERDVSRKHLEKVGVKNQKKYGICAFLAYVYLVNFLSTDDTMFTRGHTHCDCFRICCSERTTSVTSCHGKKQS